MQLNAKNKFYIILAVCFILLFLPIILRSIYTNGLLFGEESYTSLRFAQYIHDNKKLPTEDSLSYGTRPYFKEYGWHLVLSLAPHFLTKWLPFILGLLAFILFYNITRKINFQIAEIASLLLIISPAFIYLFSTATKYSMAIFLSLLGFYFYLEKKEKTALTIFILTGFFSYIISIFILLMYLFYAQSNKKMKSFVVLLIFNVITFLLQFNKIFTLGLPETFFGFTDKGIVSLLQLLLSDFGGKQGISIFLFLLGIVGVYYMWKEKYKYLIVYIILAILIIFSVYINFLVYYTAIILSIFAAYAILELLKSEWKSYTLKFLTILALSCGLLFSTVSYVDRITHFTPSQGFAEGLEFLRNENITTTVFSHYTRGSYLSYTGKRNYMDDNFLYAPNVFGRERDMHRLFKSKDINEAVAMINKYGIQYIWLDTELREELYGNTEKEFLFLLRYSPQSFKKVFYNADVEIYKYEYVNLTLLSSKAIFKNNSSILININKTINLT